MSSVKYVGDELEMIMTDLAMYVTNILFRLRQWSEIFFLLSMQTYGYRL